MGDCGYLVILFDIPKWKNMVESMVDVNDLYEKEEEKYGLELEPHVTVFYGLEGNINHEVLKPYLMPSHYIKVDFKRINLFRNEEYDVLKFECESKALSTLYTILDRIFEHQKTYDEYRPHMTIAYLKPGTGDKYIRDLPHPFTLVPSGYKFTYIDGGTELFDVEPISGENIVVR